MRFLIPGPAFEDSFADNVAVALQGLGHDVVVSRASNPASWRLPKYVLGMVEERLSALVPTREDRALLRMAKEAKPDIILALTWDVHPEVLSELRRICPGRRVLWWGDAPANSRRWGLANPEWDHVYVKDPAAIPKLRLLGKRATLLHEAMNPRWHRVVASVRNSEVAIAGNFYGSRQVLARRLHRDGVSLGLYGPKPPRWSLREIRSLHSGRYLIKEEKSRAFGEALACLNSVSFAEGDSLNCRAFEIAGAGGLQLIEDHPIVASCFEPGLEVLTFSSYDELLGLIDRASRAPEEISRVREAGARRALSEHTYQHRLIRMLKDLS